LALGLTFSLLPSGPLDQVARVHFEFHSLFWFGFGPNRPGRPRPQQAKAFLLAFIRVFLPQSNGFLQPSVNFFVSPSIFISDVSCHLEVGSSDEYHHPTTSFHIPSKSMHFNSPPALFHGAVSPLNPILFLPDFPEHKRLD